MNNIEGPKSTGGILEQIKQVNVVYYKQLTKEVIEKAMEEVFKTEEPEIGEVSPGIYHIGNFCYTNKRGYKNYLAKLDREMRKLINQ